MISIAICDDDSQEIERVSGLLTRYKNNNPHLDIKMHSFSAPLELLTYVEVHGGFDILMLDIYMNGMLGIDAARALRQMGDQGEFIFLTSSREHAVEAFEVDASQYLIKPYTESSFFLVLGKVIQRITTDRRFVVTFKTSEGLTRLSIRDVVFTETGRNNYQLIHTIQGNKVEVRMTATEIFELLSQNEFFVRCGASINVNLKYIRQISKDSITFDTGEQLSYPYRTYQSLKEAFLRFQMATED